MKQSSSPSPRLGRHRSPATRPGSRSAPDERNLACEHVVGVVGERVEQVVLHQFLEKRRPLLERLLRSLHLVFIEAIEVRKLRERDLHKRPPKCLRRRNGNGHRRAESDGLAPAVRPELDCTRTARWRRRARGGRPCLALDGRAILQVALQRVDELARLKANGAGVEVGARCAALARKQLC